MIRRHGARVHCAASEDALRWLGRRVAAPMSSCRGHFAFHYSRTFGDSRLRRALSCGPATFCATALYSHMPYTCIHTLLRWLMPHAQPLSTVRWALRGARDVRLRFIARPRLPVSRSQALATGRTRSDTLLRTLLSPRPACTRRMTPPCAWSCRACAAAPAPTGFPGTHAHPTPPTHRASRRPRSCTRASQRRAPHRS